MGLFGLSKKEKEFAAKIEQQEAEIRRLETLVHPDKKLLDEWHEKMQEIERKVEEKESYYNGLLANEADAKNRIDYLNSLMQENQCTIDAQRVEIVRNDIELEIQTFGIYTPTYEFANSDLYKNELKRVREEQKKRITEGTACTGNTQYCVVNNSSKEGVKMLKGFQKLLLRAFNTECDNIIENVRVSNYDRCVEKMEKARDTISKCSASMKIQISDSYLDLKKKELALALDFAQKKQEEKERLKELREQQREEAKAKKEIEEARKKLQKEQSHYQNALKAIIAQLEKNPSDPNLIAKRAELETDIEETNKAIEDVDYREANKRAGYVYIISNIGAFGEGIYKIGMTRRLDPMERVNELGDASVPFNFDVHALIFTEDAPGLESALHKAFDDRKVNKINTRREFFRVSLDEIKKVVRENFDKTVEWIDFPAAEQYRQSIGSNQI